jgi:hypothetical protein
MLRWNIRDAAMIHRYESYLPTWKMEIILASCKLEGCKIDQRHFTLLWHGMDIFQRGTAKSSLYLNCGYWARADLLYDEEARAVTVYSGNPIQVKVNVQVKLPLCLTKHHAMKDPIQYFKNKCRIFTSG